MLAGSLREPRRLAWAAASAALPVGVALAYAFWTAQSGGVTWANSRLTLGGTLEFVRDPQTPGVLVRRIVEDCMTLAVYLLPLWLLLLPGLRGLRAAVQTAKWFPLGSASQTPSAGGATDHTPLGSASQAPSAGGAADHSPLTGQSQIPSTHVRATQGSATLSSAPQTFGTGLRAAWAFWPLVGGVTAAVFIFTAFRLSQRGEYLPYLTDVVTRQGLRPYLAYFAYASGAFRPDILPLWCWAVLTVLGCAGGWVLAVLALRRFSWDGRRWFPALPRPALPGELSAGSDKASALPGPFGRSAAPPDRTRSTRSGAGLVYWSAFCLAGPTLLFPEFYERFLLPFLPVAIILLLDAGRRTRAAPRFAAAGVVVLALCSLALMKDYWGWMDLRWPVAQSVVGTGVPLQKLDGGYEWDGWNLYDQSMDVIRQKGLAMQITPWAYVIDPQYMLAFAPLAGYHVAREVRFNSPFGAAAGRFFVLEKD